MRCAISQCGMNGHLALAFFRSSCRNWANSVPVMMALAPKRVLTSSTEDALRNREGATPYRKRLAGEESN